MSDRAPIRFDIPAGSPPRSCLSCGSRIYWIETPRGKRMCVEADGTSHFARCADAAKFRGKTRAELREQGELFGKGK